MTEPTAEPDPLAPLRQALLTRARADADATLARADESARGALAAARQEADELLADARAKGAQEAAVLAAAERARASRTAREVVMAARRTAHDGLRAQARAAVGELWRGDSGPLLAEALRARIASELGPGADVVDEPGGVVGRGPGRTLAFRMSDLADRLVDGLGPDVEELWSP